MDCPTPIAPLPSAPQPVASTPPASRRRPARPAPDGAMARLKADTSLVHRRLERAPPLRRLFAKDYTQGEYRQLLSRFYGFYSAVEPGLLTHPPALEDPRLGQPKAPALAADLMALGLTGGEVAQLPRCHAPPPLATPAQRLGVLYVLAGANLGGVIIHRRLEARFGPTIRPALNYYRGDEAVIYPAWAAFGQALEAHARALGGDDYPAMADAARGTFTALEAWL
ncbi:MAG: biliverdin-producing heme oxygenase [Candidatus Competibacterales bacterium]